MKFEKENMGFVQNEPNYAHKGQFSQIHFYLGYFYGSFNPYFVNCMGKLLKSALSLMALLVWLMKGHMMVDE